MGLSLEDLQEELLSNLGLLEGDLETAELNRLINRSWWEVQTKLNLRQNEAEGSLTLTDGVREYDASDIDADFEAIRHISILNPDGTTYDRIKQTDYANLADVLETDEGMEATPTRYAIWKDQIHFDPTPDQEYTCKILYRAILDDIADTIDAPREVHEIILLGATYRGWMKLGNYNRSNFVRANQVELINTYLSTESKDQIDNAYAAARNVRPIYRVK